MLRSLLVGLDGSAYSASALKLGIRWAKHSGAVLAGIGVVDDPTIRHPEPVPLGGGAFKREAVEAALAEAQAKVAAFLEAFRRQTQEAGVASKEHKELGDAAETILREAQRYDAILLGKETYFQFTNQNEPGETLHDVIKHSPRPVVAVPEELGDGQSIVIAYDGSLQAARALQTFEATGIGRSEGAEIHVLMIGDDAAPCQACVDRAVDFLKFHALEATPHIVEDGPIGPTILDFAKQVNAGLVVMGAYGKKTLREFVLGSCTRRMLKDTNLPLFVSH